MVDQDGELGCCNRDHHMWVHGYMAAHWAHKWCPGWWSGMVSLGAAVGVTTCGPMVTWWPTGPKSGGRGGRGGTPSRPNAKTPRRNTKDEIRNTKDQIRNANAKFDQIRNTNAEFDQIRNANLIRPNTKYEIRNMKYEIRNMKYEIRIFYMKHEPIDHRRLSQKSCC